MPETFDVDFEPEQPLTALPGVSGSNSSFGGPQSPVGPRIVPYLNRSGHDQCANYRPRPFTIWTPAQFLAFAVEQTAMLLGGGYVERGEWTALVGIGGLGKTRLLLWLVVAIITGRFWCGLPTFGGPIKCLLLSTENGLRRWQEDLAKVKNELAPHEWELVEENLRLLALTPDEEGDLNLGDADNVARLRATLQAEQPGFIGLDPFADIVDGDENSTADMVRTLRTLRAIHRQGAPTAAVVLVHHARTGAGNVAQAGDNFSAGNFARGAKALYSRVRCELQLAPGDKTDSNRLVLACGKANNCERFKPRGLVFDPDRFTYAVDDSFDLDAWRADVNGQRSGQSVSIADVVKSLKILCPYNGDNTSAKTLVDHVVEATAGSGRSVKRRIADAVAQEYLCKPRHGFYALGSKPLNV